MHTCASTNRDTHVHSISSPSGQTLIHHHPNLSPLERQELLSLSMDVCGQLVSSRVRHSWSFWGQGTGEKWGTRREAGNLDENRRGAKRMDQIREKVGNCPRAGGEERRKKDTGNRGPGSSHDSQCRAREDEDETIEQCIEQCIGGVWRLGSCMGRSSTEYQFSTHTQQPGHQAMGQGWDPPG